MKRPLQTICIGSVETGCYGGECCCDVEDDTCFFIGKGVLTDGFFTERVVPYKRDSDVVLVDWEAKVEEFELAVVAIEEVSSRRVFTCSAGILS